jgi:hypothetical protein
MSFAVALEESPRPSFDINITDTKHVNKTRTIHETISTSNGEYPTRVIKAKLEVRFTTDGPKERPKILFTDVNSYKFVVRLES